MTTTLSDCRADIASALASTGVRVYEISPEVPVSPCYVITADAPWIVPHRLGPGFRYEVNYLVRCVVDARNNNAALVKTEEMIEDACLALQGIAQVNTAQPPQIQELGGQGFILVTDLAISTYAQE